MLVLALAGFGASAAPAQELTNVPGLKESLDALQAQALSAKAAAAAPKKEPIEHSHRLGHALSPIATQETPDVSKYSVRGVDVSHFEGVIQWDQVKKAGTAFAFMKATEGDTYADDTFRTNWLGAAAAKIPRGAYHFYNFCDDGATQAKNFMKALDAVPRDGALPMVVDLEESEDCPKAKMPKPAVFIKDLNDFVGLVRAAYGLQPILYVNLGIYDQYLVGAGAAYKLWIADPSHKAPRMPAGESWTFWQYSWHGKVAGIPAETDLDAFGGDAAALSRLAQP